MELDPGLVGTPLKDLEITVSWRDTMNYAAALNYTNEIYFDDLDESRLMAPPMFSVALTWKILGRIWEYVDPDLFPMEIISRQVHHSEYLEFHRPIQPGQNLIIRGRVAAILPHRAGTRIVIRFDALDRDKGPVFTEFMGGLMRGVQCAGEGGGEENLPVIPEKPGESDDWRSTLSISSHLPYIYDGCSDIFFPIHTSRKFARQVGLPDIILQGTATLALAVREIIDREWGGDPNPLRKIHSRFTGMVYPGTDIQVQKTRSCETGETKQIFFDVLNHEGKKALSDGFIEIAHP